MNKLLPCPFCDNKNDLSVKKNNQYGNCSFYYVQCGQCFAKGRILYPIGWVECEEAAREAWNDRVFIDDEQMRNEITDLRSFINNIKRDIGKYFR